MLLQIQDHLVTAFKITSYSDILPLLVLLVPALIILGLHYGQEWSVRRSFRQYWESAPKPEAGSSRNRPAAAPRKPLISQARATAGGAH